MAYCKNCGTEVDSNAYVCVKCGCLINDTPAKSEKSDIPSALWGILGYMVPVAGLILWILWKTDRPQDAKAAGLGALINTILSVVLVALYLGIYFFTLASFFGGTFFLS